jgi:CheY-like chemotaxis protein
MYILLVENDSNQVEMLEASLNKAFPEIKVERIRTEFEFTESFNKVKKTPPVVIILDVMMQWAKVSENIPPPPPEVQEQGTRRAGIRCAKRLANDPETKMIPVILYTVLENADLEEELKELPSRVYFIQKQERDDLLLNQIRKIIGVQQ